ncbi:hypothetical protein NLI96_g11958 [Meripilus lineatus]|uniref:DUF5127 domain-containing protein n=1 Tax=Meripilus lineatus TaxID=2056292 RepID=A0AAD5UQZ9_9APHY|nr:hypothetical protein NLI96_g11958 [Physisporinus lineatus]
MVFLVLLLLAAFAQVIPRYVCQSNEYPFSGTVPLAIRSPYFNTWINATGPNTNLPNFWTGSETPCTWSGLVTIDGVTWSWLGAANDGLNVHNAIIKSSTITPTRTIYVYETESMDLTVTFLSPIEASDPVKQSLPFIYLSFEAKATDGNVHNVQLYSDVGADWMAQSPYDSVRIWNSTGTNAFWKATSKQMIPLAEISNQAADVMLYYATQNVPGMVQRFGSDIEGHTLFSQSGLSGLSRTATDQTAIAGNVDVFSMAFDLGNIRATNASIVWTLGLVRDSSVSYTPTSGETQLRYPYYVSQFAHVEDAINKILGDFDSAAKSAIELDEKLLNQSSAISAQYMDLVSLAARQTMGGTELTIALGSDGLWNISDVKAFMKDVGSSGRINPVEILYASFPFFLYIDPPYAGWLLAPLLEVQESTSQWAEPYAARDLVCPTQKLGDVSSG